MSFGEQQGFSDAVGTHWGGGPREAAETMPMSAKAKARRIYICETHGAGDGDASS
jgi:hypothetical protein